MMNVKQFATGAESCASAITFHQETGENYDGAVCIGTYNTDDSEIWLEFNGARINIPVVHVAAFCKELQRVAKLAKAK